MAWCFKSEQSTYTEAVLDRLATESAIVPAIWPLEVVNVLLVAERRKVLSSASAEAFLETLSELPIAISWFNWPNGAEILLLRGRSTGLTAYDAAYLELAVRLGYPLATRDRKLQAAAEQLGVALVES
ncbi:MAG: type II toxin-antitoxin system VapC family toxin [Firmicutes bacterium]|nr:type II toxin-antitoxin system VapC family toxin [Bacillota bacterium]